MQRRPERGAQAEARYRRLMEELERFRRLLAEDPDVLHLTLFGSLANGRVHEWSDLDLAVVMRTEERFSQRAVTLARRLRPAVGTQFLVYTPSEWLELITTRRFVREEILKKGRMVPLRPLEEARRWLAYARDDVRAAEVTLREGLLGPSCFHAQQAVEKCLKALLVAQGELVPRTHEIRDLWGWLDPVARTRLEPLAEEIHTLDSYYQSTRYPDAAPGTGPEGLPSQEAAQEAVKVAAAVWQATEAILRERDAGAGPSPVP